MSKLHPFRATVQTQTRALEVVCDGRSIQINDAAKMAAPLFTLDRASLDSLLSALMRADDDLRRRTLVQQLETEGLKSTWNEPLELPMRLRRAGAL